MSRTKSSKAKLPKKLTIQLGKKPDLEKVISLATPSERWAEALVKYTKNCVWTSDKDLQVFYVNPSMCRLLGYKPEEIVGKSEYDFWSKDTIVKVKKVVATDRKQGISSSYEGKLIAKSGEEIPVFCLGTPLPGGGTAGMMTDLREIKKKDLELRESEAKYKQLFKKYRELFNNISSGVAVYEAIDNGEDFVFVNFNNAAEKIEKIKREKVIGKKVTKVFPSIKKIGLLEVFKRVWQTGKPEQFPIAFYSDKRVSGWRENYVYKLPNGQVVAVYDDVTKRKQAEDLLEKRLREFNMLYHAHSRIKIAHGFSFVLNNIAKDIANVFSKDEIFVQIVYDGKKYKSGQFKKIFYEFETPIVLFGVQRGVIKLGYTKQIPGSKNPFTPEERKLIETVANIISKHAATREVIERHEKVVKRSITSLFIIEGGAIKYVNPSFFRMFKYKKNDAVGRSLSDFILDCPSYEKMAIDSKISSLRSVAKGKRSDGKEIDLDVVYQKIDYHGRRATLVRAHDITKLKEAEQKMKHFNDELKQLVNEKTRHLEIANQRLQSLNELKDEFIAVASHELRSPLTSIRGYLSFLVEKESLDHMPEDLQQYLLRAYSNAESLNHLVNNILDVSRLDTGRFELQTVKTDLIQLTKNIIDSLSFQANEKNLVVYFQNPNNFKELLIDIDSIRISQVLRNILDNAIKYSRSSGRITIEVTKDMGFAIINIIDEGVGIPKAEIANIFDKFTQSKSSGEKFKSGAGLGLFISKRIIQLHGGIIKVDSERDRGTTFTIQLPLIKHDQEN